jgi:hypothetical protein
METGSTIYLTESTFFSKDDDVDDKPTRYDSGRSPAASFFLCDAPVGAP